MVASLERERESERNHFHSRENEGDRVCGVEDLSKWHDGDKVAELRFPTTLSEVAATV